MKAVVWYASWQMECCGDPFATGDEVSWTVEDAVDDEWLAAALGPAVAASITHAEEHHSDDPHLPRIGGRVASITEAWCAFGPAHPGDRVHVPLLGAARFAAVEHAGTAHLTTFPGLMFSGWVVELEAIAE